MQDAGILNGDFVVVRSQAVAEFGDFVAAMIDGEATVKEFQKDSQGLWLVPHNELFEPIPAEDAQILGKVAAVLRKI
ncbi:umuDC operon protein-like protein [Corynebacterium falsenii DSM 44353]|nr:umuDC operon protein-like protein [Corynebacterium falsenii DSM 44353]